MLSRIMTINVKNQSLVFELQDGIAVAPSFAEFKKLKQPYVHLILRNIKDQGVTAFWASSNHEQQKVYEHVFPNDVSQKLIEKHQLRSLRSPREVKPHEKMRQKFDDQIVSKEGLCINPVYINLGKVSQKIVPDLKPIKLDPNIPYIWLHNAEGEIVLGVEKIWDYTKLCELSNQAVEQVEMLKQAILDNFIQSYLAADEKQENQKKLAKKQLKEAEKAISTLAQHEAKHGVLALEKAVGKHELKAETSMELKENDKLKKPATEKHKQNETPTEHMLRKRGGIGHTSLSPIYDSYGKVISLKGQAYMGGEFIHKKGKGVLSDKSGRFFSNKDSVKSNMQFLKNAAAFMSWRLGEAIDIELQKNKLDPEFLWNKALHVKMDEFKGDKVKIAFNSLSKVYKYCDCMTQEEILKIKMTIAEKEKIFNSFFPATSEERFASAIVYILDTILPFEKNENIRAGLVKQIQYMIEHQLPESLPVVRKVALGNLLHERQREIWSIGENETIIIDTLSSNQTKFGV